MCGICGMARSHHDHPVDPRLIAVMRDHITHRGPDEAGIHCANGVGFGHRRLSVIDLAGGSQPMANEDSTVWVVFNGEIYNFRELTARLQARGHTFKTRSDTEVLVHAYEEYGLDFVQHLNGMFAFAIHDLRQQRVVLGRDHLGIKPLFYSMRAGTLFFGSEIKAVLAGMGSPPEISQEALVEYLVFRYCAWSRSFFEGIHRLPPGHVAVWEGGSLRLHQYWRPSTAPGPTSPTLSETVETLDQLLADSVRSQMISDVPLGTFCSGGVDSGLITRYAAEASAHALETFSVAFEDSAWDESALANDSARRVSAKHRSITARPAQFLELLPQLIRYNDEPLSHPNAIPLFVLSGLARRHVTVVLTGEGADELLAGYPRYQIERIRHVLGGFPDVALKAIVLAAGLLPGHRARRFSDLVARPTDDAIVLNSAYVRPSLVARLTGASVDRSLDERRKLARASFVNGDPVASLVRYELATYLVCALDRMDRMSMAHSLEGRVPFLDIPFVEWALALPSVFKMKGIENKRILKTLARRYLHPKITDGPKSGFGVPLPEWFRQPAFEPLLDRLRDATHPASTLFDPRVVATLVSDHLSGKADHSEALWLLSNVYVWHEVHSEWRTRVSSSTGTVT